MIEGGDGARQHRWMDFTHAHGGEQTHLLQLRGHAGREGQRILADLVGRRKQDVLVAQAVGRAYDIAAMIEAGA